MINRSDVLQAESRISGYVRRTPLLRGGTAAAPLWFKCEFLQHTGVFKARGAFNRLLAARERGELDPGVGVVAASGGNAGLANAYAAAALGVPATVFVPENAPRVKVERLLGYNATVRQVGAEYAEAFAAAMEYVEESGALFCHAYDQLEIAAGAGTVAEEILQDEPGIDTIVVAVGGGGLYAGVAAAAEGRARVVAVEPFNIPTLHAALTPAARSTWPSPESPRIPWAPGGWAGSLSTSRRVSLRRPCWWTTPPLSPPGHSCGATTGSPPNTARRRHLLRSPQGRTRPAKGNAWQ